MLLHSTFGLIFPVFSNGPLFPPIAFILALVSLLLLFIPIFHCIFIRSLLEFKMFEVIGNAFGPVFNLLQQLLFVAVNFHPSFLGYTPSSTSSSLAPASRTGSSLTGEAANKA